MSSMTSPFSLLIWTSSPFCLLPDLYNSGLYKHCNCLNTHLCPTGLWVHSGNSPRLAFLASNSVWLTNDTQFRFANEFLIFLLPWSAGSAGSLTRLCWPLQAPFMNSRIMPHSQLSPHPCLFQARVHTAAFVTKIMLHLLSGIMPNPISVQDFKGPRSLGEVTLGYQSNTKVRPRF